MIKEILCKILKERTALDIKAIPVEEKRQCKPFLWILAFQYLHFTFDFSRKAFRSGKLSVLKIAKINF